MARILIIDDDPELRAMLEQTFHEAGHEVALAANGNQGMELQCAKPASVIITDLLMPEKEGLETIVEFRKDFPKVPIITISGRPSTEFFLYMAKRLGSIQTFEKPFRPSELLAAVEQVLAGKG
jgi:DNA-binding response OmpR family regulator